MNATYSKVVSKRLSAPALLGLVGASYAVLMLGFGLGSIGVNLLFGGGWMYVMGMVLVWGFAIAVATLLLSLPGWRLTLESDSQGTVFRKRYSVYGMKLYTRCWQDVRVQVKRDRGIGGGGEHGTGRSPSVRITAVGSDGSSEVVLTNFAAGIFGIERFWTA